MGSPFFNRPFFHLMSNHISNFQRQFFSLFNGLFQFFIHLFRKASLHYSVIENIFPKNLNHIYILTHLFILSLLPLFPGGHRMLYLPELLYPLLFFPSYRIKIWGSPLVIQADCPRFYKTQALFTEPNNSIFSLTVALIASAPGARSFLGSYPLPC